MSNKIYYRPEIDGLRTIAVMSVLIFHAEYAYKNGIFLSGGFLGVDIFFVISGYLITSIIVKSLNDGSFSFANFYERRARRILPALFTVIIASIPFAWILLSPKAIKEYANSVLYSLFFSSNFWFWLEDSYWAEPSALKPFLHTWSLAIEEQFYIFTPFILIITWRLARKYMHIVILIILALSLLFAEYASRTHPEFSFFMLPSRMWELAAGSLLAIFELRYGRTNNIAISKYLTLLGMLFIFWSFFFFDDKTLHPSLITIIPILGTSLIVWFGGNNDPVSRLLSCRLFVGIGLISYGLYLWHYPVFAFSRIMDTDITSLDRTLWIVYSIALAVTSYYLIEKPFRNNRNIGLRKLIYTLSVCMVFLVVFNGYIVYKDGLAERFPDKKDYLAMAERVSLKQDERICHDRAVQDACVFGNENAEITILNIGDSHMDTLGVSLAAQADKLGYRYIHLTHAGCLFFFDYKMTDKGVTNGLCDEKYNQERFDLVKNTKNAIVITGGRAPKTMSQFAAFDNGSGGVERAFSDYKIVLKNESGNIGDEIHKSLEIIKENASKTVLIYPNPIAGWNTMNELSKMDPYEIESAKLRYDADVFKTYSQNAYEVYDSLSDEGLVRIYPEKYICDGKWCNVIVDGEVNFQDTNHIAMHVAEEIVNEILIKLDIK
jgi:peptidoglycan/LPS O-acetylase OafA/YrhL